MCPRFWATVTALQRSLAVLHAHIVSPLFGGSESTKCTLAEAHFSRPNCITAPKKPRNSYLNGLKDIENRVNPQDGTILAARNASSVDFAYSKRPVLGICHRLVVGLRRERDITGRRLDPSARATHGWPCGGRAKRPYGDDADARAEQSGDVYNYDTYRRT